MSFLEKSDGMAEQGIASGRWTVEVVDRRTWLLANGCGSALVSGASQLQVDL